jgi:regulator of replication initiation timing
METIEEGPYNPLMCGRCGHVSGSKLLFLKHLKRTRICQPYFRDVSYKDLENEYFEYMRTHPKPNRSIKKAEPIAELSALKSEPSALKTELSALKSEPSALKTELSALKTEQSALKTEVTALKTELTALKTEMNAKRQGKKDKNSAETIEFYKNEFRLIKQQMLDQQLHHARELDNIKMLINMQGLNVSGLSTDVSSEEDNGMHVQADGDELTNTPIIITTETMSILDDELLTCFIEQDIVKLTKKDFFSDSGTLRTNNGVFEALSEPGGIWKTITDENDINRKLANALAASCDKLLDIGEICPCERLEDFRRLVGSRTYNPRMTSKELSVTHADLTSSNYMNTHWMKEMRKFVFGDDVDDSDNDSV